jgi:hypothetical protein
MKEKQLELLTKVANGELTPEQAQPELLGLFSVMPRKLTAENGAKALLCGEFNETVLIPNEEYCGCGECDYCVDFPDTEEYIVQKVPIPWTTIKEIYDKIVAFYGA